MAAFFVPAIPAFLAVLSFPSFPHQCINGVISRGPEPRTPHAMGHEAFFSALARIIRFG
jgi:hypothetical protein|tara:strand:+ start:23211 stop:23387 length:177 start_codon:yes stop_codon:yes gene_type:complete